MRTIVRLACGAGALVVAACSSNDVSVDDGLKKDLELAFEASPISLQAPQPAAQVVSDIERTAAPRRTAPSQRAVRRTPAPRRNPDPVEVPEADVAEEVEETPVEVASASPEIAPVSSRRPQPVRSDGIGRGADGIDGDIRGDRGSGIGTIISVVLRGGIGDIDECDPRTDGRRGGRVHTAVNNRIPIVGTFPGGGIQGTFPGSGRLQAALPGGRRVRF